MAASSKGDALDPGYDIEVRIIAQDGQTMLSSHCRNPGVVGGNGCGALFQPQPDLRILASGIDPHHRQFDGRKVLVQPLLVTLPVSGLKDAEQEFTQDHDWHHHARRGLEVTTDARLAIGPG